MSEHPEQSPEERAIREILQPLTDVPPRDPRQAASRRAYFLSQASKFKTPVSSSPFSRLKVWLLSQERYQFRTLTIAVLLAVIFLGTVSASAYASRQALPGDPLYGIKIFLEEAQLSLTGDQTRDLELHLQFANNRVGELQTILSQPGAQEPGSLAGNFNRHVETAEGLLAEVDNPDDYHTQLVQIQADYDQLHGEEEDEDVSPVQEPGDNEPSTDPQEDATELEAGKPDGESDEDVEGETPDASGTQESREDSSPAEETDDISEDDHEQEDDENDHSQEEKEEEGTSEPDPTHESDEENDS